MSEFSLFWPTGTTGDGATEYTDTQLFAWLRRTFNSDHPSAGPLAGYGGELEVTADSGKVTIGTGAAYVYGIPYESDTAEEVSIPTPAGSARIDRIVLRADWSAKTVRITRIPGTEGGAAPSLTQTPGAIYDVPLAQVSVTTGGIITVTDERVYCRFATRVAAENLDDGAVTTDKLANNAVTTGKIASNAITDARLRDSSPLSVIGRAANSSGDPADIAAGSDGQVLRRSGTTLGFGTVATAGIDDNAVTNAKLRDSSPLSVIGRASNTTGDPADIVAGSDGQVLLRSGNTLGFGQVTTEGIADRAVTAAKLAPGTQAKPFIKGMILPFSGTLGGTNNHYPIDRDTGQPDMRWHLCNGEIENGVQTPNLRDKFILAAGSTYPADSTGGSATKNLSHTHGAGSYYANAHTHSVNLTTGAPNRKDSPTTGTIPIYVAADDHTHGVVGNTGGSQPGVSGTSESGGSATQDIMPPYYALAYICYVGD